MSGSLRNVPWETWAIGATSLIALVVRGFVLAGNLRAWRRLHEMEQDPSDPRRARLTRGLWRAVHGQIRLSVVLAFDSLSFTGIALVSVWLVLWPSPTLAVWAGHYIVAVYCATQVAITFLAASDLRVRE